MSLEAATNALVQAYVACNLAKDSLHDLPHHTAVAIEGPIEELCRVVGAELRKIRPDIVPAEI
jgi:hypothetical protein